MTDYSKNAWKYYEYGRAYNSNLTPNQYSLVHTNSEFFAGNQWINMPDNEAMRRLAKPTFNILKRITSMFVANLTSSGTTISFEPLAGRDDGEAAGFATNEVRNLLEKFKMDFRIRDALFDGAITGDYCAHFIWNPSAKPYGGAFGDFHGEIEMELVDGINVMFGNPNTTRVEKQPYIIIVGRDTVENLKTEKEFWEGRIGDGSFLPSQGKKELSPIFPEVENSGTVLPDNEWLGVGNLERYGVSGDDDKSQRATYIYMYTKSNGTVHITKATRTCTIYENIDTGLSRYPIAWGVWQRQKNQYHGRALVTEVIPNQIFINQMMAMIFRHLQCQAFPTRIFNADLLPGISNEVGTAIGVRNLQPGQSLGTAIATIPAADMSNQIISAIELCMQYTKECLGATDAQLGSSQATNTSALMVLQNASEVPLENTRAGLNEWIEDIGAILLDMMGTYYGERPVSRTIEVSIPVTGDDGKPLIDPMTGQPAATKTRQQIMQLYDFGKFKNLWFNIAVDVGATTYYSEIAMVQTLDNLRKDGVLDVIEYLERIPDKLISRKDDLIRKIKEKEEITDAGSNVAGAVSGKSNGGFSMGSVTDASKRISNMPQTVQGMYNKLPMVAQNALKKIY